MKIIEQQKFTFPAHSWRCMLERASVTFKKPDGKPITVNFLWDWTSCPEFANVETMSEQEKDILYPKLFNEFKESFSISNTPYILKSDSFEYVVTPENFISLEFSRTNSLR